MSGAEIVLGVAGLLGPLIAPPLESAFRHLRKPQYNHYHAREELRGNFIDSWSTLQGSLSRLAPVLGTLTHDDPDRRKVLREMEKATKALRKVNKGLLGCKPIKRALREQEKTEKIVSAVRRRICDGEEREEKEEEGEEEDKKHSKINHRKIKDRLGPLIVGGKGRHSVSNRPPSPIPPPHAPPLTPIIATPPSPPPIPSSISTPSISLPPSPSPQNTQAPRALLSPLPPNPSSSSLHLQIITKTHHHSRRRRHHHRKHKGESEGDEGCFGNQKFVGSYDTPVRPRDREEGGEGRNRHCHHHYHHHHCGGGTEVGCSRILLAGG